MDTKHNGQPSTTIWAYAYEIVPPQSEERMHAIRELIDKEHAVAKQKSRTWRGKMVLKEQVTHILVVSDSAKQNRDINRRLEAVFRELKVGFSLTAPMFVEDDEASASRPRKAS